MAAHLRELAKCRCGKPAVVELFNTWNSPQGRFCKRHGEEALRSFWREHPDHAPEPRR